MKILIDFFFLLKLIEEVVRWDYNLLRFKYMMIISNCVGVILLNLEIILILQQAHSDLC